MTSIKSLLEQSQDVNTKEIDERSVEEWPYEYHHGIDVNKTGRFGYQCGYEDGHKSRNAEVEKLKRALIVMWEAEERTIKLVEDFVDKFTIEALSNPPKEVGHLALLEFLNCLNRSRNALAKAREILKGGDEKS